MKAAIVLVLVLVSAQSALAGQEWQCEGQGNDRERVYVTFETVSNTVIKNVIVTDNDVVISEGKGSVRRDAGYKSTRYENYNRFDVSGEAESLNLLLPNKLARLDDEFSAYLQVNMGTAGADTVALTCTGKE